METKPPLLRGRWIDIQVGDTWVGTDDVHVTAVEPVAADDVFVIPTQRVFGRINGGRKIYRWTFPADMYVEVERAVA